MNPLEDIIVALQPITPQLPWPIPNSVRLNDVTGMATFTNLNPFSNGGAATIDGPTNFGWEYVWHCHILGHEENDMGCGLLQRDVSVVFILARCLPRASMSPLAAR